VPNHPHGAGERSETCSGSVRYLIGAEDLWHQGTCHGSETDTWKLTCPQQHWQNKPHGLPLIVIIVYVKSKNKKDPETLMWENRGSRLASAFASVKKLTLTGEKPISSAIDKLFITLSQPCSLVISRKRFGSSVSRLMLRLSSPASLSRCSLRGRVTPFVVMPIDCKLLTGDLSLFSSPAKIVTLSMESNPFSAKNQTLRSYRVVSISPTKYVSSAPIQVESLFKLNIFLFGALQPKTSKQAVDWSNGWRYDKQRIEHVSSATAKQYQSQNP